MNELQSGTCPSDVRHLTQAQHLLLFGCRAAAIGGCDCPVVRRAFAALLGREADGALNSLLVFVRLLGFVSPRRVGLQPPGCCRVSPDERWIVAAVAAAQASLCGQGDGVARACLARLLDGPASEAMLIAAQGIAASLTLGGQSLAGPDLGGPSPDRLAGVARGSRMLH